MTKIQIGARLHDLPKVSVDERIKIAGDIGFDCVQLPSKVIYDDQNAGRECLTKGYAEHIAQVCESAGLKPAMFGCYKNLVHPDPVEIENILEEYRAGLQFAKWLSEFCECKVSVGTETGRPNAEFAIRDDRFERSAFVRLVENFKRVCDMAEELDTSMLLEGSWNEVVNTPELVNEAYMTINSPKLELLYDAINLLHYSILDNEDAEVQRMLDLNGRYVAYCHAKDYEIVDNEDEPEWYDGSGHRLKCHGVGVTGNFDYSKVINWIASNSPKELVSVVVEDGTPETLSGCLSHLRALIANANL